MKYAAIAGALALASLAGCATNGALTPTAATDITTALAIGCPILSSVQGSGLKLNASAKAAAATLALACPPNLPPTSAVVAAADLVSAYTILAPLIKK
ncbi:MAG: hypothetical protein WAN43_16195 [Rhodomicrobium sp.]